MSSHPGLTRGGRLAQHEALGPRGEPEAYYPTGVRNFLRVDPLREDLQGVAHAMLAKQLRAEEGLRGPRTVGGPAGRLHRPVQQGRAAPGGRGRRLVGVRRDAKSHDALAKRVARADVQGVLIADTWDTGRSSVLKALRARLGPRAVMMGVEPIGPVANLLELAGPAARGST